MMAMMRLLAVALAAAVVVGCSSTSDREPSTPATASTGPGATDRAAATTAAPAASASPIATPSPRPSRPSPSQSPTRRRLLTRQGLGGVPVGSTLGEFAEALERSPAPMSAAERSVFDEHRCAIRRLARLPGVGFMVIGDDPAGSVRRISIEQGSDVRTDTGIRLGSSLADVRTDYGPGLEEPFDHYPVGGDAVLIRSGPGSDLYLAFIGDDRDRVVEVRIGYKPEVLHPEGCV